MRRYQWTVRGALPCGGDPGARCVWLAARPQCLWLQGAGWQSGQSEGRATLPFRGLSAEIRLGCNGPGGCRQGDAPGEQRVDQGRGASAGGASQEGAVWWLGG